MNNIDFIWSGEIVSMVEKEGKYHIKVFCSSQLVEISFPKPESRYRLGERVIVRGRLRVEEITKSNERGINQDTSP